MVLEDDNLFGLSLLDAVNLVALLEPNNLPNDVLPVVGHAQEGPLDALLKVGKLDPLAKLAAPDHYLLELLQRDFLDTL